MTGKAKIGCAALIVAALGCIGEVCVGLYVLVSFGEGIELSKQGFADVAAANYDGAITRFGAALEKPLGSYYRSSVYLNRGFAFSEKQRFDEAIRDYTEALRINPELEYAYEGRGRA